MAAQTKQEYMQKWMDSFNQFIVETIAQLLSEFEKQRFEQGGVINDHAKWDKNQPYYARQDKDGDKPLIDTGELMREATNLDQWSTNIKAVYSNFTTAVSIPDKISWEDPKYAKQLTGFNAKFFGRKTGRFYQLDVPARDFASISEADIESITQQLIAKIKEKYS